MRTPAYKNIFKKDLKRMVRRGKDSNKIKKIITLLINNMPLDEKHRDHTLSGNYINRRECHIEPDWLLVYKLDNNLIIFERTGTHADLFE